MPLIKWIETAKGVRMNIVQFGINAPVEMALESPQGTVVQGRYGDRVMFHLADGRVMYVPPIVATRIEANGISPGERFELCKTRIANGGARTIEWRVRRLGPEETADAEGETQLESDLRASTEIALVKKRESANRNGNGHASEPPSNSAPTTKLEDALKTAISAAYNAEKYGADLGYVVRFDSDAIKSMAITVLINMNAEGRR